MTSALLLAALVPAISSPTAHAADREFQTIVGKLSSHYQKKPMRFMGLLGFVASRFTPPGVSGMKFAIFEDLQPERRLSGDGIDSLIEAAATRGRFVPFVKVRSNRDGEQVFIYAREEAGRFEMLMVTMEEAEAVVMKMHLSPEAMARWIDQPVSKSREDTRGHNAH